MLCFQVVALPPNGGKHLNEMKLKLKRFYTFWLFHKVDPISTECEKRRLYDSYVMRILISLLMNGCQSNCGLSVLKNIFNITKI